METDSKKVVELNEIMDDVLDILCEAQEQKAQIGGAVNWGNLYCTVVEWVEIDSDGYGPFARVYIEEAAPDAWMLSNFVATKLHLKGYVKIEVVTAW